MAAGTVFALIPPTISGGAWTENVLYSFTGGSDGGNPYSGLISGPNYTLYGTTLIGGVFGSYAQNHGSGTVFALAPPAASGGAWSESVLHAFRIPGSGDGIAPYAAPLLAKNGSLYGTTGGGGASGIGTVYRLRPPAIPGGSWSEGIISFTGGSDGANTYADLVANNGKLYGTTSGGGALGFGTVFEVTP